MSLIQTEVKFWVINLNLSQVMCYESVIWTEVVLLDMSQWFKLKLCFELLFSDLNWSCFMCNESVIWTEVVLWVLSQWFALWKEDQWMDHNNGWASAGAAAASSWLVTWCCG